MSTEEKLRAVLDYGEKLKIRAENDILFDKIKSHINLVIIVIMILYYFRHIILDNQNNLEKFPKLDNSDNSKEIMSNQQQKIQYIMYKPTPKDLRISRLNQSNMRFLN